MREYRIVRTDLGWIIYRKKQMGRLMLLQYLNGKGLWVSNKGFAKIFYNRESAVSSLIIVKHKDEGKKSD